MISCNTKQTEKDSVGSSALLYGQQLSMACCSSTRAASVVRHEFAQRRKHEIVPQCTRRVHPQFEKSIVFRLFVLLSYELCIRRRRTQAR